MSTVIDVAFTVVLVLGAVRVLDWTSRRWLTGTYLFAVGALFAYYVRNVITGRWGWAAVCAAGLVMVPFAYRADATRNRRRNETKP